MRNLRATLRLAALGFACLVATLPAVAQAPELAMLGGLERGGWELRLRPEGGTMQICVRNGREFIQLRHRQPACERFVVQDDPDEVTVQYTCPGNGYGRTTIRRENAALIQIHSQGSQGGTPFSIEGEARKTGAC